jgi:predicted dehydrogenase
MDKGLIKTGLASFGMSGHLFHAPFIKHHPNFELTTVLERTKNLARERYPEVRTVRSLDELLADDDLEVIVVNTPDSTHYDYSKRALLAGKNVIVEKPFTFTTAEGRELIEIAGERGLMLCVYQNRRWDGDFLTVKQILDQNLLGRLVEFESVFARYRNFIKQGTWKEQESGMAYNLGSHIIDQCVSLFGLPEAVWADTAILRDNGIVEDYFCIHLLRCAKAPDVRITLKASYLMREPEPRFVLHGTNGSYVKYGVDIQEEKLQQGFTPDDPYAPGVPGWGIEPEERWGTIITDKPWKNQTVCNGAKEKYPTLKGDYTGFYESVYRHLRHGEPLPTDAKEVLPVISVIEAALESSRKNEVIKNKFA